MRWRRRKGKGEGEGSLGLPRGLDNREVVRGGPLRGRALLLPHQQHLPGWIHTCGNSCGTWPTTGVPTRTRLELAACSRLYTPVHPRKVTWDRGGRERERGGDPPPWTPRFSSTKGTKKLSVIIVARRELHLQCPESNCNPLPETRLSSSFLARTGICCVSGRSMPRGNG